MDKKHLRMSGLQWQYRRKYPAAVAKLTNRNWKIHNLGTDSLKEAQRLRNRLNVEFDDALVAVRTSEAEQLAEYQAASDHNREGLWYHYSNQADDMWHEANRKGDEKGKQDVID